MPADPDLDALDALLKAATPGPWEVSYLNSSNTTVDGMWGAYDISVIGLRHEDDYRYTFLDVSCEDAALIAAAVNALPALLAGARVLEAEAKLETAAIQAEAYLEEGGDDFSGLRYAELMKERVAARQEYDAARARYRALLEETPDA